MQQQLVQLLFSPCYRWAIHGSYRKKWTSNKLEGWGLGFANLAIQFCP